MMSKAHFLWVDDEIDFLKPHILFLEEKGYLTDCASNGRDALSLYRSGAYDIVFLDENMPGLSGLETLTQLYEINPRTPVVMITKSEDEGIMNQAIGKKIADYLIKPVNPNQVLLTIKKILDKRYLVSQTATVDYRDAYNHISENISQSNSVDDWKNIYRDLIYWELELERTGNSLYDLAKIQKSEANISFARFVRNNYREWLKNDQVVLSPGVFKYHVYPVLDSVNKLFFILIDNFRLDQWEGVKEDLNEYYEYHEDIYISILPTVTPYSRNSVFSGLMPVHIKEKYPEMWVEEDEDEGKNNFEETLIHNQLLSSGRKESFSYHKINSNSEGRKIIERFSELEKKDLNVLVFNFIDSLSHTRTESEMLRELTSDEAAYRSVTRAWFQHSPISTLLKMIAEKGYRVIITSDHGSIRVRNGIKVKGDIETGKNLRYKFGKSLAYDPKKVFDIIHPENFGLPSRNLSTRYIFAQNHDFFVYHNNYNSYSGYYSNSFQHGGISMEEMMVPIIELTPKQT